MSENLRHLTVPDPFLAALDELEEVLEANDRRAASIRSRIAHVREQRAAGRELSAVVPEEEPPLIVQLVTESATALDSCGARVRRAEALALHAEGVTMDRIAVLFGVSRQRVSTLLRGR